MAIVDLIILIGSIILPHTPGSKKSPFQNVLIIVDYISFLIYPYYVKILIRFGALRYEIFTAT